MDNKFDVALLEKAGEEGLTREEAISLIDKLREDYFYPIELLANVNEYSAMGFITVQTADRMDFDYESSGLHKFLASLMDDREYRTEDGAYEYHGVDIFLGE